MDLHLNQIMGLLESKCRSPLIKKELHESIMELHRSCNRHKYFIELHPLILEFRK